MADEVQLTVIADGKKLSCGRVKMTGSDSVGLRPSVFYLSLWNLTDGDAHFLSRARLVRVFRGASLLAAGYVANVVRKITQAGSVTHVAFSMGLPLWEAGVSLSVQAGVTVSETARMILEASGTGVLLLSFPGADPSFRRGQAYLGRAAECVSLALSAASARGYLTEAGLCVVPEMPLAVTMKIGEEDLVHDPFYPDPDHAVLRVRAAGWPLGKAAVVAYRGIETEGLIVERSFGIDTETNEWNCELLLEVRR